MNTDRKIRIDSTLVAIRNPRTESSADFLLRAVKLEFERYVAETVPQRALSTTNHGNALS